MPYSSDSLRLCRLSSTVNISIPAVTEFCRQLTDLFNVRGCNLFTCDAEVMNRRDEAVSQADAVVAECENKINLYYERCESYRRLAASAQDDDARANYERQVMFFEQQISQIRLVIDGCRDVRDAIFDCADGYIEKLDFLSSQFDQKAFDVPEVLKQYVGLLETDPLYSDFDSVRTSSARRKAVLAESNDLEHDILAVAEGAVQLPESPIGASIDHSDIGAQLREAAHCIEGVTDESYLDKFKEGEKNSLIRRKPSRNGSWYNSDNQLVSCPCDMSGSYYWVPDGGHVFGSNKTNPKRMSAAQVMKRYGFRGFEFKNGYPVFPAEAVVASVDLDWKLSASRKGGINFKMADELFMRAGRNGVSPNLLSIIEKYLSARGQYEGWFTSAEQVKSFRSAYKLTWHEHQNMKTLQLVHSEVHAMVAHEGGIANAKYRDKLVHDFSLLAEE